MSAKNVNRPLTGWFRMAAGTLAMAAGFLLCGFMKPQLPQTIYDGTHYDALIAAYEHAYVAVGMTTVKIVSEAESRESDGTVRTVKTFTFSCPKSPKLSEDTCSVSFSISAAVKGGICQDCRVTRTSYVGDPAADEKALREVRKALGKA